MFDEDHSVFFETDDFAETVTLDGIIEVNGIFDEEFIESNFIETKKPTFTYAENDYPVEINSEIVRGLKTYLVKGIEPDGTGITRLVLEKQNG